VPLSTSTVQLASSAKNLDMSMPKYDEIKSFKASVENVKSLSMAPEKGGNMGISASAKKRNTPLRSVRPNTEKNFPKVKTSSDGYTF
jgi:hypothetical protein